MIETSVTFASRIGYVSNNPHRSDSRRLSTPIFIKPAQQVFDRIVGPRLRYKVPVTDPGIGRQERHADLPFLLLQVDSVGDFLSGKN